MPRVGCQLKGTYRGNHPSLSIGTARFDVRGLARARYVSSQPKLTLADPKKCAF